jgi:hypothetical protein
MLCDVGTELIRQYEVATKDRNVARDILLTSSTRHFKVQDHPFEDLMFVARHVAQCMAETIRCSLLRCEGV